MKLQYALILAAVAIPRPALAQTSSRDMKGGIGQPTPPAQHEPATAATPPQTAAGSKTGAGAAATPEKVDPAKEAAIRHLLDVTNESRLTEAITNEIMQQVRTVMSHAIAPDRLPKFMESFAQKFTAAAPSSAITDAVIPIYARNFSMEDIQALVQFYETPLGKRMVKTLPEVEQESQSVGLQMDKNAALGVLRGMTDEYAELKQLLPPDRSNTEATPGTAPAPAPTPVPAPGATPAPKPGPAPSPAPAPAPAPVPAPAPPQQR